MLHCPNTTGGNNLSGGQMNFPQEEEEHMHQRDFGLLLPPNHQHQHQHQHLNFEAALVDSGGSDGDEPGLGLEDNWSSYSYQGINNGCSGFQMNYHHHPILSSSSAMEDAAAAVSEITRRGDSMSSVDGFNKRIFQYPNNLKAVAEDEMSSKRRKRKSIKTEQNINNNNNSSNRNRETCADADDDTSKDNSKVSEVVKPDYIHVRARRGQATDSHSLAERVRREKISERMKYLQDLVPGCNKITGKAGMLDEIINYVQSLQKQVEFLSMKLATVNPTLDFDATDHFFAEQAIQASSTGVTSEMANPPYLMFSPLQPVVSCPDSDALLQRSNSPPVAIPEMYLNSLCFDQIPPSSTWDANLQNFYPIEFLHEKSTVYSSPQYTGTIEAGSLKIEK